MIGRVAACTCDPRPRKIKPPEGLNPYRSLDHIARFFTAARALGRRLVVENVGSYPPPFTVGRASSNSYHPAGLDHTDVSTTRRRLPTLVTLTYTCVALVFRLPFQVVAADGSRPAFAIINCLDNHDHPHPDLHTRATCVVLCTSPRFSRGIVSTHRRRWLLPGLQQRTINPPDRQYPHIYAHPSPLVLPHIPVVHHAPRSSAIKCLRPHGPRSLDSKSPPQKKTHATVVGVRHLTFSEATLSQ